MYQTNLPEWPDRDRIAKSDFWQVYVPPDRKMISRIFRLLVIIAMGMQVAASVAAAVYFGVHGGINVLVCSLACGGAAACCAYYLVTAVFAECSIGRTIHDSRL